MSKILGPDGAPVEEEIPPDVLKRILQSFSMRLDATSQQLIQLGLLTEYMHTELDNQGIKISLDNFPEFAQKRYKEIQEETRKAVEEQKTRIEDIRKKMSEEHIPLEVAVTEEEAAQLPPDALSTEETSVKTEPEVN